MRLLVCGDRRWKDFLAVYNCISGYKAIYGRDLAVIAGGAPGADSFAEEACKRLNVLFIIYKAQWEKYGKAAGPIRNKQMRDEGRPDEVVAFHNNIANSRGTKHMVKIAHDAGIPVRIQTYVDKGNGIQED